MVTATFDFDTALSSATSHNITHQPGTMYFNVYMDTGFTTWAEAITAAGTPSDLEQFLIDNYSNVAMMALASYTEVDGYAMDDTVVDPSIQKENQDGMGYCITEAEMAEGATEATDKAEGVTWCILFGGNTRWEEYCTQNFEEIDWVVTKTSTK